MKKLLRNLLATVTIIGTSVIANAQGQMDILGSTYTVDTVFHAKIGPGTTQTHLALKGASTLQVFYLTIDKRTPGVSLRAVSAKDMVAGTERTSAMAERKSTNGVTYFAGVNGDFFTTSGNATNGSSKVGSPTTSSIVDREIFRSSNSQYQFVVDTEGVARVGRLNYYSGTATLGNKVTLLKGFNGSSDVKNGIIIYTSKYWGSTNRTERKDNCAEVTARLVEGDNFYAGTKYRMEITSEPNSSGDTTIPSGGFVLHACGNSLNDNINTGAQDFINSLKVGDIVEFDNVIKLDGEQIIPAQTVSGNPKNVGGGKTLDTENERGDASDLHPRTGIGVSQTGDSIIMMVIDGRNAGVSDGVRTSMLADVMRYAKVWEGVNLDGGGSSTLYTRALGVRNSGSDGNERAVGNAIFAVFEAPETDKQDNTITEIAFEKRSIKLPPFGYFTPVIYGYNKYGEMVDNNVQGYTLSCDQSLGEIVEDEKTFYGTGAGKGELIATYNGITAKLPIEINSTQPTFKYNNVLLDNYREWNIEVQSLVDGEYLALNPQALSWASSDNTIAEVNDLGVVKGINDGTATITGTVNEFTNTANVTVECPQSRYQLIEKDIDVAAWNENISAYGVSDCNVTSSGESSISINLTMASGRNHTIQVNKKNQIWSLPDAVKFKLNQGDTPIKTAYIEFKSNNNIAKRYSIKSTANTDTDYEINFAELYDVSDAQIYPISINALIFSLNNGTVGALHSINISDIQAVYNNVPLGVEEVLVDETFDGVPTYYNLQGVQIENPKSGLYIVKRGNKVTKEYITR